MYHTAPTEWPLGASVNRWFVFGAGEMCGIVSTGLSESTLLSVGDILVQSPRTGLL